MLAPVVRPSKTPERISASSGSSRWVTMLLCPGRRRARSAARSPAASGSPAGQPSMMTRFPGPCASPPVVMRNACPKLLPASADS